MTSDGVREENACERRERGKQLTDAMRAKRSLIDDDVDPVAGPDGVTPNRRRRRRRRLHRRRPSGFAFWAVRPSANGNADRTHRF